MQSRATGCGMRRVDGCICGVNLGRAHQMHRLTGGWHFSHEGFRRLPVGRHICCQGAVSTSPDSALYTPLTSQTAGVPERGPRTCRPWFWIFLLPTLVLEFLRCRPCFWILLLSALVLEIVFVVDPGSGIFLLSTTQPACRLQHNGSTELNHDARGKCTLHPTDKPNCRCPRTVYTPQSLQVGSGAGHTEQASGCPITVYTPLPRTLC